MKNLKKLCGEKTLTLYWDKPDDAQENESYKVYIDDIFHGKTKKTHFAVENLKPETEYCIRIERYREGATLEKDIFKLETTKNKKNIDVTKEPYCAVGDGTTLNTKKIQKAIDACGENERIYFPRGIYLTGALNLHSNMEFFLDEGAVLQGSDKVEDYLPKIRSRFEGTEMECYSSLLNLGEMNYRGGYTCKNVVICGKGTICGGGRKLAENIISLEKERMQPCLEKMQKKISECENENTIPGRVRPRLINISNAQNIRITGLTIKNGPSWNVHMIYSDSIITDHCTFYSKDVWNGDGWDPDSSSNCTIFACTFYTGDDAIAIKSGKNPEGNIINIPSREIRIFDCVCAFGNGIAIGSEMSGGVCNVKIWDCDLSKSMYGLEVKGTKKRGGYVENIEVANCVVPRILFHAVEYNDDGVGAETPPIFKNCRFRDITITGVCLDLIQGKVRNCEAVIIQGFDQKDSYVENIVLENISILSQPGECPGVFLENCKNIFLENVSTKEDKEWSKRKFPFAGKEMYAFGDSIVKGHTYLKGFADFIAEEQRIKLRKYAVNGSSVLEAGLIGGQIIQQLAAAPEKSPDYILFDGGINDAEYLKVYEKDVPIKNFSEAFEKLVYELKRKWPEAKIIYVTAHKMCSRDEKIQQKLYEMACGICQKWNVTVADIYKNTSFNTNDNIQRKIYTFNACGADGLPGNNGTGTHPNIKAIEKFYVPVVMKELLKLA